MSEKFRINPVAVFMQNAQKDIMRNCLKFYMLISRSNEVTHILTLKTVSS